MPTPSLPFAFPLALILVDDDREVVDSLMSAFKRMFPGRKLYAAFSGQEALVTMSTLPFSFTPLPDLSSYSWTDGGHLESSYSAKGIEGLNALERHAQNVGMAIFDYAMPRMTGLEFAQQICCPGKILLTGQATQTDAINAFNAGSIGRYVPKDIKDAMYVLRDYIYELEVDFFAKANREFCALVGNSVLPFLVDQNAHAALATVCKDLKARLISPSLDPAGVFVQSLNGDRCLIVVVNDEEMESQIRMAEIENATPQSIQSMKDRTHLYMTDIPDLPWGKDDPFSMTGLVQLRALSPEYWYAVLGLEPSRPEFVPK